MIVTISINKILKIDRLHETKIHMHCELIEIGYNKEANHKTTP